MAALLLYMLLLENDFRVKRPPTELFHTEYKIEYKITSDFSFSDGKRPRKPSRNLLTRESIREALTKDIG
jgi:hypothetical protein